MSSNLRRTMGLTHATAMVVGIIVGASIFVQPSEITRLVPSVPGLILVWMTAGALTLCGALVCAELASVFPHTGGVYIFLRNIFSPAVGFLWGWGMFWSMHSGIIAAIAVIMARYVGFFVPLSEVEIRALAVGAILLLSAVNYAGVRLGGGVQVVLTIAKIGAVALLGLLLFGFGGAVHRSMPAVAESPSVSFFAVATGVAAGLFAFGGWHMVTYAAGETHEPERTIPRALLIGTLIVTGAYVLLNSAYTYVLPLSQVASSTRVATDATTRVLGPGAAGLIAGVVIVSCLGAVNGIILAGPRVYYAMAQEGLAFRWMGAVHPRRQTPHLAIVAQAIWSSLLVGTNTYRQLFTRVVYTEWMFFALLAAGLFLLRRRPDYRPTFVARGYPLVPAAFIVVSLAVVVSQIAADPRGNLIGLGLLLLGLPVYLVWSRIQRSPEVAKAHADH